MRFLNWIHDDNGIVDLYYIEACGLTTSLYELYVDFRTNCSMFFVIVVDFVFSGVHDVLI